MVSFRKRLAKAICGAVDYYGAVDSSFFYIQPVADVLCGFTCIVLPSGSCRLSKFVFPLFDHRVQVSLIYSDRMPHVKEHIPLQGMSPADVAAEFFVRTEPYREEVYSLGTTRSFAQWVETRDLRNPWARRGYALALIKLERTDEARHQLGLLQDISHTALWPDFDDDVRAVSDALSNGLECQIGLLERWTVESRKKFGVD